MTHLICCSPLDALKDLQILLKSWGMVPQTSFQVRPDKCWIQRRNHLIWPAGYPCLVHPRMVFALLADRAHCWCMLILLSATTTMLLFISAGLFSSHSSHRLCLALPCPRCRIGPWDFFNSMSLMIAQLSNLCRSLCKASHTLKESAAPPCFVLSTNLLRVHSSPTSTDHW